MGRLEMAFGVLGDAGIGEKKVVVGRRRRLLHRDLRELVSMEDSTLPTRDMFPMNEIFVNDVVGSSKTVPTEVVEDEDGFRMDSSEVFAGNEEGDA
ncbi:hypothetical protein L6452_41889 [Arctium lappa]|uniref:Uncharacterized protein n=1 Tax=Arctium lappa TaxID=4217 RepID=A0ACB8XGP2_ARCLA|nr:hypothetical protein L6452_41889 [Arctium lappa]